MGLFRRSPRREPARAVRGSAASGASSRVVVLLLDRLEGAAQRGEEPQVLLIGPPSGRTIETFTRRGCRVTVEGEDAPSAPLQHIASSFAAIVGFDALDLLADEPARALGAEWARVLAPGGWVYILAAPTRGRTARRRRLEIGPGGELIPLSPREASGSSPHPRENREIEVLLRPLSPRENVLRRDGWREMLFHKARPGG